MKNIKRGALEPDAENEYKRELALTENTLQTWRNVFDYLSDPEGFQNEKDFLKECSGSGWVKKESYWKKAEARLKAELGVIV